MTKKYVLSILTLLMVFSCIRVYAKSVDPYIMNKNEQEYINVEFQESFYTVKIKVSNGEIVGWSELTQTTKNMTDEDLALMLIDCAELLYGKGTERYELNRDKFITLLEEGKFNYSDFITFQDKDIQPRCEFLIDLDQYMNITFSDSSFGVAVRGHDGEITGYGPCPQSDMTDEKMAQMVIDCAEVIFGKDTERYELNKEKFTTLYEEGGMQWYDKKE